MSTGIYYVEDNPLMPNDDALISSVISQVPITGGRVVLSNRTYTISQSIVLRSHIVFCGAGVSSEILCTTDVPIIRIDRGNGSSSSYIEICDMRMRYLSMNTSESFHVEADRPIGLKICNVIFNGAGRVHSGVLTWDASSQNKQKKINAGEDSPAFMTHIEKCIFDCASIWLNDSDSRIINNYIWGNTTVGTNYISAAIRLSNSAINISGNDIVAGNDAGILLASTCSGIRIENNYFDGSWENVCTGWGISIAGAFHVLILGNFFNESYYGGINVLSSYQLTISKNIFSNLNRSCDSSSRYDIKIISGAVLTTGHLIEGNQHFRARNDSQHYAVHVDNNTQATIVNNSLIDWGADGYNSYFKPPFVMQTNKYAVRKDNRVTSRIPQQGGNVIDYYPYQFDEGQVTVSNGSSPQSVAVSFSPDFVAQNILPKVQDIYVSFVGSSSTSAVAFSVWGISTSGFNIAFRPVDNSTTDGIFFWRVSPQ